MQGDGVRTAEKEYVGHCFVSVKLCTLVGALASADVSDIESQLLGAVHQ